MITNNILFVFTFEFMITKLHSSKNNLASMRRDGQSNTKKLEHTLRRTFFLLAIFIYVYLYLHCIKLTMLNISHAFII